MSSPRLLLPDASLDDGAITLSGAALRHLRAFRLRSGDTLVVANGRGREWDVVLTDVGPHRATGRVARSTTVNRESPLTLELAPALLKGPRMDAIFEKGTELGVQRFRPVLTTRVQGRPDNVDRWRRIVVAAAEQSGRTSVPIVDAPISLAALLGDADGTCLLVGHTDAERSFDLTGDHPIRRVLALTGPEGGLTPEEVRVVAAAGGRLVGLGPRILRAETAAIVLAALVQHRLGDA